MSRVRRPDVAEDLVQEALLAALRNADTFQERSQERTWLVGILRHKVLDHFRKAKRDDDLKADTREKNQGTLGLFNKRGRWAKQPCEWKDDPASVYEQREFWEAYDACRRRLPQALSEAYILRELEGLSVEESCNVLEISSTNLSVRLHRARLALRECLEKNWFES
ncbi:MAG: sigma-70 family RNA polymerase sigma factor [Phycisphaeraceae bacterium]|nr:sigma-70 family RNA polymerase sigma factor [Phycisphaeraceae bacterium]